MKLVDDLASRLATWDAAGLRRELRLLRGVGPLVADSGGKPFLNFSSNDYLGLAGDPRLKPRPSTPAGAAASRLITGHLQEHADLESALADLVQLPSTLLFSSGFAASLGTIPALLEPGDVIFSDQLNHASLIDGARLSRAQTYVYPHLDMSKLEQLLKAHRGPGRSLVLTDSLFSMDGDVAPLKELAALCERHDAWLYVDEAHAIGVLGPDGRGLCAASMVSPDVLLGTLGKSFGAGGAFIAGDQELRDWLIQRARSFVFSTGLSPILVDVAHHALTIARQEPWRRQAVLEHAQRLREALRALGFHVPPGRGPIVPVILGTNTEALRVSCHLLELGILAVPIRPPTVPAGEARLRLTPMATHSADQVGQVIDAFQTLS